VMEKFIRRYPKSHLRGEAHAELGDLYFHLRNYPKALEQYEWVMKNQPQYRLIKKVYLDGEEGYRSLGRLDEAERTLKELVAKFPQDDVRYEGHLRLGLLYMNQKKYTDAISAFSLAARSPEESVAGQAQFRLGEAFFAANNREQALLQFSRVVYLYPDQAEIFEESLLRLGALYGEEKRFVEARQVYQKLLEKTKREDRREVARKMLEQIQQESNR
jgi:TolA-binding protein